jgi:hypothetical protein
VAEEARDLALGVSRNSSDIAAARQAAAAIRDSLLGKCYLEYRSILCKDVQRKYEALLTFLQSPESQRLREESERYLAEGKQVSVRISNNEGKPKYELIIK